MRMNTNRNLIVAGAITALVIVSAVVADAGRRHVDEYEAPSGPMPVDSGALNDDSMTPEELAELKRQAELEAEFTASNQPGELFAEAEAGRGPSATGLSLETALGAAGPSRLDSMRVISVMTDSGDGVEYEEVMYGDGSRTGYILVYWQNLLGDEEISSFVGEFGEIKDAGPYDIITDVRNDPGHRLRLVRVYDGARILSVQANDIKGLEIGELIPLAEKLFNNLPES